MPIRVVLLLFDGFDLLDVGGPYEVLLTANRLMVRRGDSAPFELTTAAPRRGPVAAHGGLAVLPATTVDDLETLDVAIVPGMIDIGGVLADEQLVATTASLARRARLATVSVCTGAFLLAAAGMLRDRPATTHHEDAPTLDARDDVGGVVSDVRWVDDGDVVTIGGLASGLAGALHLVDRLAGRELALTTARQLEHAWDPDGHDVVP